MNTRPSPDVDAMLEKLVQYRTGTEKPHIEKYSKEYVMGVIDDRDQIQLINHNIHETDPKGIDVVDFVKLLLSIIPHTEDQTLYITAGIIDLFKDICETYSLNNLVKGIDVLNYIVEVIFLNSGIIARNFLIKTPAWISFQRNCCLRKTTSRNKLKSGTSI